MDALSRGQDILSQIGTVDLLPDGPGSGSGFLHREASVSSEVGGGITESRFAQKKEPLDIPLFDVGLMRIDIDRKIEKVRDEVTMLLATIPIAGFVPIS